jgi:hypothetical protein
MTKSDEELVERASAEFAAKLRGKIDEYRVLDDREELNINRIDGMWSLARQASDEVLKKVYTELVNSSCEKKLLKKKKRIEDAGNRSQEQREADTADRDDERAVGNTADDIEDNGGLQGSERKGI